MGEGRNGRRKGEQEKRKAKGLQKGGGQREEEVRRETGMGCYGREKVCRVRSGRHARS